MDAQQIREFLAGRQEPKATLDFLTDEFIPAVVAKLNEPGTRRRMALYGGDGIPKTSATLRTCETA